MFNIRRVGAEDNSADIILVIEGAERGGPVDAIIKQINIEDKIRFERDGWTFSRNKRANVTGPTMSFKPLKRDDLSSNTKLKENHCITHYMYDDPQAQGRNGGGWRLPTGSSLEFPDYALAYVFTGLSDNFEGKVSEEGAKLLAEQKALVPSCLFEEIGHALTFWADVHSPLGEVPFNAGDYVNWDPSKESVTSYVASTYKEQMPKIRKTFRLFKELGLKNGMSRADVLNIFLSESK